MKSLKLDCPERVDKESPPAGFIVFAVTAPTSSLSSLEAVEAWFREIGGGPENFVKLFGYTTSVEFVTSHVDFSSLAHFLLELFHP